MNITAQREVLHVRTSALGSMNHSYRDPISETVAISTAGAGLTFVTANTDPLGAVTTWLTFLSPVESTASEPVGKLLYPLLSSQTTGEAVMEIRRLSGLTWEELADLFGVSRRSIHHWANGKAVTAKHDRMIRNTLAAIRHLDRGDQVGTRALLLTIDQATGISALDLLKNGHFDEARGRVESIQAPKPQRVPLSRAARDARRPPSPVLLLGANQEQPDIPAKVRVVRAKRPPKTAG